MPRSDRMVGGKRGSYFCPYGYGHTRFGKVRGYEGSYPHQIASDIVPSQQNHLDFGVCLVKKKMNVIINIKK